MHTALSVLYRCCRSSLLAVVLLLFVSGASSTSFAKECEPGGCSEVKIFNCSGTGLLVSFEVCCDGELVRTDYYRLSARHCPPNDPAYFNFGNCTLTGRFFVISTLPYPVTVNYDPSNCYAYIN